jgi:hypothetical protein
MNHFMDSLIKVFSFALPKEGPHLRHFKTEYSRDYVHFVRTTGRSPSETECMAFLQSR